MADEESGLFSQAVERGLELLSPLATQREENTELTEEQERVNDDALRDVMDPNSSANVRTGSASVGGGDVYSDQVFDEVVDRLTSPKKNKKNYLGEATSSNLEWASKEVGDDELLESHVILPKD